MADIQLKRTFNIDINSIFYTKHKSAEARAQEKVIANLGILKVNVFDYSTRSYVETNVNVSKKFVLENTGVNVDAQTFKGSGDFAIIFAYNEDENEYNEQQGPSSPFDVNDADTINKLREYAHKAITEYVTAFMGDQYGQKLNTNKGYLQPLSNSKTNRIFGFSFGYTLQIAGDINFKWGQWLNQSTGNDLTMSRILLGFRNGTISVAYKFGKAAIGELLGGATHILSDLVSFKINTTYGEFGIPGSDLIKKLGNEVKNWALEKVGKFEQWLKKALTISVNANTFISILQKQIDNDYPGNSITEIKARTIQGELLYLKQRYKSSKNLKEMFNNTFRFTKSRYCIQLIVRENDPNYSFYNVDTITSLTYRALKQIYGHVPYLTEWVSMRNEFNKETGVGTGVLTAKPHSIAGAADKALNFGRKQLDKIKGNDTTDKDYNKKYFTLLRTAVAVARIQDIPPEHVNSRLKSLTAYTSAPSRTLEESFNNDAFLERSMKKLFNIFFSKNTTNKYNYIFEAGTTSTPKVDSTVIQYIHNFVLLLYERYKQYKEKCFDEFINNNVDYGDDSLYKQVSGVGGSIEKVEFTEPKPSAFPGLTEKVNSRKEFFEQMLTLFTQLENDTTRGKDGVCFYAEEAIIKLYIQNIQAVTYDSDTGAFAITLSSQPDYTNIKTMLNKYDNEIKEMLKNRNKRRDNSITSKISGDTKEDAYLIRIPYLTLNDINDK